MFHKLSDLPRRVTVTRITPEDMRHPQLAPRPVTCLYCHEPVVRDDHDTLVDSTGGDVCGVRDAAAGTGLPHADTVPCPQCGTPLEIDPQCRIEHLVAVPYLNRALPIPRREKVRPAALCSACDFCMEIRS